MKKPEDFFSISGRSVSKGFTAPSEARAVIETQGSKVPPEDTLLSEMEQKSKGFFPFLMLVGTFFCSISSSFQHLSVLNWPLTASAASKNHY